MTRLTRTVLYGTVAAVAVTAATAQAADLAPVVKAPDSLFSGVTFYGQLDVAGACTNAGPPQGGSGLPAYMLFGNTNAFNPNCGVISNAITQSLVGVKIEKPIGYGFTAIGDISTGFIPTSGEVSNAAGSVARSNTSFFGGNASFGDGGRDGQLFNGPVFAGISSATFGTLTAGRISSLQRDNVLAYDPQGGSYAFSLIGFYGAFSGTGDTEDAFWDNALKYVYDNGPFHLGAAVSSGSPDASQQGAWSVDAGLHDPFFLRGFSIDAMYAHVKDGVSAFAPFAPGAFGTNVANPAWLSGVSATDQLQTRVSDNDAYSVQGKYVIILPGWSGPVYTKEPPTPATFTLYGGWEHYTRSDPSNPLVNGTMMVGGYVQGVVNNFEYVTAQQEDVFWVGGKYAVNNWSFTGAWYHQIQNSWLASTPTATNTGYGTIQAVGAAAACNGIASGVTKAGSGATSGYSVFAVGSNCAGTFDVVSFVVDYAFNKYFDIYTGVNYNQVLGGFQSGLIVSSQVTGVTGMRLRF